jgi:hypothetical protein
MEWRVLGPLEQYVGTVGIPKDTVQYDAMRCDMRRERFVDLIICRASCHHNHSSHSSSLNHSKGHQIFLRLGLQNWSSLQLA